MRALATSTGVAESVSITVTATSSGTGGPVPSRIDLLVSSPQLDSDGSDTVTLTALVRTVTNNIVSGAVVNFTADSGLIQVVRATTDATGTATALLTTGGDPTNRTINATATTGTLTPATNMVQVTGTTLTLSGATASVLGSTTPLSILLRDSGGNGIPNRLVTLSSALANTLTPSTVSTNFTGGGTVNVTVLVAGTDTIQASALGAMGTATLSISAANFSFTMPQAGTNVPLNTLQTVVVHWEEAGVPVPDGRTVNFSATRGMLSAPSALTVNGNATVTISSNEAGIAVISASAPGGPSSQVTIEFFATTPNAMVLQAFPTTLGINPGGSTAQQSVIAAIVQDVNGNLVKGQTVSFTLADITGGSIFPPSAVTDSFGRASTVYTASAVPSAQNGVIITAVVGAVPPVQVRLTVAQQALFVILGTGNLILTPSNTQFAQPYSVLVTDVNGNPVTNATVELTILPTRYSKGIYTQDCPPGGGWRQLVATTCDNEDLNRNGILDLTPIDEDVNGNDKLDPGNVATVSVPGGRVTTDANGFAFFNVVYAREFATWVEVALQARATVAGSEGLSQAKFFLLGLASDYAADCTVPPPGVVSPYGFAGVCTSPN